VNPASGRCKKGETKDQDLCITKNNRCIMDPYSEAKMHRKLNLGGSSSSSSSRSRNKDTSFSCGVNPASGRCKKGETKDQDLCITKNNRCIMDPYSEAKMYRKLNLDGKKVKKDASSSFSCGVNPASGRCKKGETKDQDLCTTNPKNNRCIMDPYSEAKMYRKLNLGGSSSSSSSRSRNKDTSFSCGVNPTSGRCKKGETKDQDLCITKNNRCIMDPYSEAKMYRKLNLDGKKVKKDTSSSSCGVNPASGRCKKGETKDQDLCTTNPKNNRCIMDPYSEAKMHRKLNLGGSSSSSSSRSRNKDTSFSCGVNPASGRCKKGETKDQDLCITKNNRCIMDPYSEAKMYRKLNLDGKKVKKDASSSFSCGVNPASGRCKKGETKDQDLCITKNNRCIMDPYSEAKMHRKLNL
jgi:exo-beta-1,3-glucanase (GH17 family)